MNNLELLPTNWIISHVKDISLKIHYGYTTSATNENTGIKFLRITDIQGYKVNWNDVPFCHADSIDAEKFLLSEGEIVFA
jgi:type I restriction enzyme S subunit